MAIGIYFPVQGMSIGKYRSVLERLDAAGQAHPRGRSYHAAFGSDESLEVWDVWESPEEFEAFGAVLMPILAELGVDPGEPSISPIRNVIVPA